MRSFRLCSIACALLLMLFPAPVAAAAECAYRLGVQQPETDPVQELFLPDPPGGTVPCTQPLQTITVSDADGSATASADANAGSAVIRGFASGAAPDVDGPSFVSFQCSVTIDPPSAGIIRFDVGASADWSAHDSELVSANGGGVGLISTFELDQGALASAEGRFDLVWATDGADFTLIDHSCVLGPSWNGYFDAFCASTYGLPGSFGGGRRVALPFPTSSGFEIRATLRVGGATGNAPAGGSARVETSLSLPRGVPVAVVDPGTTVTSTDCNIVDNMWQGAPVGGPNRAVHGLGPLSLLALAALLLVTGSSAGRRRRAGR